MNFHIVDFRCVVRFCDFCFYSDAFNCKDFYIFDQLIIMIFPQYVIYVLIKDDLKFRKDPSITSKEIANYISVALAVALSVCINWEKALYSHIRYISWKLAAL